MGNIAPGEPMQLHLSFGTMAGKKRTKSKFTFIDLFAGIGGFRLALESLGGECVFTSEWDPHSQKTYEAWYGDRPFGDITKIDPADIPDHDVLGAGFPCQPFSLAGVSKKNSLGRAHGFDDPTQGTLFFNIKEILRVKRPPIAILENVKNLRSHDKGKTWKVIVEALESLDYAVFSDVIDARHWVPQHRERVLIVCLDKHVFGEHSQFAFPETPYLQPDRPPVLQSILEHNVERKYTLSDKLWNYLQEYAAKHKAAGNGFGYGLANKQGISRTISARYHKDGSEILIPTNEGNPRRLKPREALRLMGFDEILDVREKDIVVSDTQAYRQFGNAVVPAVVRHAAVNAINLLLSTREKAETHSRSNQ